MSHDAYARAREQVLDLTEPGQTPPTVVIVDEPDAVPHAVRQARAIALPRALVDAIDDGALRWLLAHEMHHLIDGGGRKVKVADVVIGLELLGGVLVIGVAGAHFAGHLNTLGAIVMMGSILTCSLLLFLFVLAASRHDERQADAYAHTACATDPGAAARLFLATPKVGGLARSTRRPTFLRTHPAVLDRLHATPRASSNHDVVVTCCDVIDVPAPNGVTSTRS